LDRGAGFEISNLRFEISVPIVCGVFTPPVRAWATALPARRHSFLSDAQHFERKLVAKFLWSI
jgi:hypothetical protein